MEIQTDMQDKKAQNNRVKVAIRIRPFIEREKALNDDLCVQAASNRQILLANQKLFKFDNVFDQNSPQHEVYDFCVRQLVEKCFEGYNSAILAYGQTGSGKTYTMGTTSSQKIPYQQRGILPRVIQNIFSQIQRNSQSYKYSVHATFLQIYNQHIIDLLSQDHGSVKNLKETSIAIRQEKDGSMVIYGANEEEVFTQEQMLELLDRGSYHRTTSSTLMNEASSRSHAIFTITIERNSTGFIDTATGDENYTTAKFVFVDLAGSQRLKKTGATGNTLKQGININLGLLQLGNVISSLASQKKQAKFINYRNSKLTRILQDSLGGNSNTYMIACVSPAESNYQQTLNTIKYASKAMNIKNKPVINRDPHQAQILKLKSIIADLQKENSQLKKLMSQKGIDLSRLSLTLSCNNTSRSDCVTLTENQQTAKLKTRTVILQKKCQTLLIENKQEVKRANCLEIQLYEARRDRDLLSLRLEKLLKGEQVSDDDQGYVSVVESYLNKIRVLEEEVHEKKKGVSQLQIEYSRLYDAAERDAVILTKKTEKIFRLERKVKELEGMIKEMRDAQRVQQAEYRQQDEQKVQGESISSYNRATLSPVKQCQEFDSISNHQSQLQSSYSDLQSSANLQQDSEFLSQASNHQTEHHKLNTELKNIQKTIEDREAFFASINEEQMNLEYKLLQEMKQDYNQKIREVEKQHEKLMQETKRTNRVQTTKVQSLETELRQLKKKAQQQKTLQKQVTLQSTKLKQLSDEINTFRMQKIQLSRKMKEEKDKFNKFKSKRLKELFDAKKDNAKKDGQIRKLKVENKKQAQQAIKRKQQIKRMKKVNQTLKQLMKPKKMSRGSVPLTLSRQSQSGRLSQRSIPISIFGPKRQIGHQSPSLPLTQQQYQQIISQSVKSLLIQIRCQLQKQRILQKCQQIEKEIDQLKEEQSQLGIRKERLEMKSEMSLLSQDEVRSYVDLQKKEQQRLLIQQLSLRLNQIDQRVSNLQQDLQLKVKKYNDLAQQPLLFNYETEIIYNKRHQTVEAFRFIVTSLYRSIIRLLTQNTNLSEELETLQFQCNQQHTQLLKAKQQVYQLNLQFQQKTQQLRQQYLHLKLQLQEQRYNSRGDLGELQNCSTIGNEVKGLIGQTAKVSEEQLKKKYQKKIEELNKNNKGLVKELEVIRKKCEIVTEKYNSIKGLINKDRFVGVVKEDEGNYAMLEREFKGLAAFGNSGKGARMETVIKQGNPNSNYQEDDCNNDNNIMHNNITNNNINPNHHRRPIHPFLPPNQTQNPQRLSTQLAELQFNKNSWQLAAEIPNAHKSPILSLASNENLLVSSASKSIIVWDLESCSMVQELSSPLTNSTFVKSVVIHPQRQILFSTADKVVNVWDLRTFRPEMVLKGHKDEIRLLYISKDTQMIFSAGKGTVNGGSIIGWDLRGGRGQFENVIEKERNQDVFSMAEKDGMLYYGTRDHFVRSMRIQNSQTQLPFQPPHMDTVTGLCTFDNFLISGSKDKNLRLWSLESSICNLKHTIHSFNEYITAIEADDYLPIFYASDRSGQVKIGTVIKEKIQFIGGIGAHTQQINAVCCLNASPRRGLFATGASDRCIKIWRPNGQTLEHILNDF